MDPAGSGECGHSTDVGTEAGAHSHSPPKRDKLVKGSGLLSAIEPLSHNHDIRGYVYIVYVLMLCLVFGVVGLGPPPLGCVL